MRILLILFTVLFISGCDTQNDKIIKIKGETMGTYYHVSFVGDNSSNSTALKERIDQRLIAINKSMSTYDPQSELSLLNKGELATDADGWVTLSPDLAEVLSMSLDVWHNSEGSFDVTVGPLINIWGFGPDKRPDNAPSNDLIQSKLSDIGSEKIELDREAHKVRLQSPLYIDLSAIAKGWAVDEIADLIEEQGYQSFMVEIGGEIRAQGKKPKNQPWRIAIERPSFNIGQDVALIVELDQQGVATSGNYRNYFEENGVRFSHTIDPNTGYPIKHNLASVTVIHESTGLADAWATAITVVGPDKGLALAEQNQLAVFMLVSENNSFKEVFSNEFIKQYPQTIEGGN